MPQPLSPPLLRSPLRRCLPPAPALPCLTLRGQGLGAPALRSDSRGRRRKRGELEGEAAGSSSPPLRLRELKGAGGGSSSRLAAVLTGAPLFFLAARPFFSPKSPQAALPSRLKERGGSSARCLAGRGG